MARTATAKTAPTTTEAATATTDAPTTVAPAPHAAALAELREIAVADIATDGSNPRTLFDLDGEAGIRELAASITAHGLVQPITVRANLDAGEGALPYLLVAGERRLRATRDVLKRRTIAAIMRHDLTDDTALVLQRRLCKTAVFSGKSRPMSRLCWPSAPIIAAIRVSTASTKAPLHGYWKNPSL